MSKEKDYEIINLHESFNVEYQLIIQVTRKMYLLRDLKNHFENADRETVYCKYITGTLEYETVDGIYTEYKIYSNFLYSIFRMPLFKGDDLIF